MRPNAKPKPRAVGGVAPRRPVPTVWEAFAEAIGGLVADVGFGVVCAVAGLLRWRRHHAAIQQLQSLDDRMLRDIGIERGQITAAVHGIDRRTDGGRDGPTHPGRVAGFERRAEAPTVFGGIVTP